MRTIPKLLFVFASLAVVAGCSSQDPQMSSADFAKPENAAALEKVLSNCKLVMGSDPRAANCKEARNAKFALDKQEIARVRREQIANRDAEEVGGVTTVEMSAPKAPTATATARPTAPAVQANALTEGARVQP